jgi:CheY-like chemotaxis protein
MADSTRSVVAVVDDDHRTLESLADLLEAAGYDVRLYSSATVFCERDGLSDICSEIVQTTLNWRDLMLRYNAQTIEGATNNPCEPAASRRRGSNVTTVAASASSAVARWRASRTRMGIASDNINRSARR